MGNFQSKQISDDAELKVQVPRDYLRGPIFASCKQEAGRTIVIKKCDKVYEIGGFEPISGTNKPCPALDIRHGRALFTMLTFYKSPSEEEPARIHFSLKQFCKRYANVSASIGGKDIKVIKGLLSDLLSCWFRVTHPNGEKICYRILTRVVIHSKSRSREELWLDEVELDPEFYKLLTDYTELSGIDLKVLASISSSLAQAIYVYMPSRIVYRTEEENPFEIGLSTLLKEVGHTIPAHKSLRKQLFTQNKRSVINQLNGLPFMKGMMRVKLAETKDHDDYKLLFWNGNVNTRIPKRQKLDTFAPKLRAYWLKSGRELEVFNEKLQKVPSTLAYYQKELLEKAQITLESNESFMRVAFALLGESKFNELASEVKSLVMEPGKGPERSIKNPTKVFISLVCEALATA